MSVAGALVTLGSGTAPPVWPPVQPRAPLPAWPSATGTQPGLPQGACWSSKCDYRTTLSSDFPKVINRKIRRGNFCGVFVPGYRGGDGPNPSLLITWDLTAPRVSDAEMRAAVDYYFGTCGYYTIVLSRPQAINQVIAEHAAERGIDDPDAFGWYLTDAESRDIEAEARANFIRVANYCQSLGMTVLAVAVSDGYAFSTAQPFLDACVAAGAIVPGKDEICICWQVDKWYDPMGVCGLVVAGGPYADAFDLLLSLHWGGGYPGWAENCACWDDDTASTYGVHDRFSFQSFFASKANNPGHLGQCNQDADIDAVQSWIYKIVIAFPPSMTFTAAEMSAQMVYDAGDPALERYADEKGRLAMAAPNPLGIVLSYLNGGREETGGIL